MKAHYLHFVCILLLISLRCFAPALTITDPGIYELGEDINFSPGAADSIISIQTSDVVLNLGRRIIQQNNVTAGVDGISIAAGLSNIQISNGLIRNVTNRGIFVDTTSNVARITISDLTFFNCQNRGISFEGAGTTENCIIEDCKFINCALSATGDFVSNLSSGTTQNTRISNIFIGNDGAPSITGSARALIRTGGLTRSCVFENILAEEFTATAVDVTGFLATSQFITNLARDIRFSSINTSTTNTYTGFNLQAATATNSFINCTSSRCSAGTARHFNIASQTNNLFIGCTAHGLAASAACQGFNLTTGNGSGNLFINCLVEGCAGGIFNGFFFVNQTGTGLVDCMVQTCTGSGTSSAFNLTALTRCQMVRCYAFANSSVQDIVGLNLTLGTSCSLADCIAAGNSATSNATGITIAVPTSCTIDNCAAYRNVGTASSTGIVSGGGGSAFLRNVSLLNGATQFSGFGVNQFQTSPVLTTNSVFSPYTNVGLN